MFYICLCKMKSCYKFTLLRSARGSEKEVEAAGVIVIITGNSSSAAFASAASCDSV